MLDSQQLAWDVLEQLHVVELCVDGQGQGLDGTTHVSASQQLAWDTLEQRHLADPISNSQKVAWDLLDASTPTPSETGSCGEDALPHEANAPRQDRQPTAQEVALLASLSSSQPNSNSEPELTNAHGTASGQGAATLQIPPADQRLRLGELSPEDTGQVIAAAYEEIVHCRPNLFASPSGAHGRSVVDLSARYLNTFGTNAAGEGIALKALMVCHSLLLQQPVNCLTRKVHVECLNRRMQLWNEGNIDELVREARTIQRQLTKERGGKRAQSPDDARRFATLITNGKLGAALQSLTATPSGGLLNLDSSADGKTVRQTLKEKHPPAEPMHADALIIGPCPELPHPVLFEALNRDIIRQSVLRTNGAAGPSGMDSTSWKRLCTSFRASSDQLCDSIAACAKRIATGIINPISLKSFTACRLVPLDKKPGVRPIGICEVLRRIVGKAILTIIGEQIQQAVGSLQLCGGQECGVEAAIHAMRHLWNEEETEAVLLADASNAFNRLNRSMCLHNIRHLCPAIAGAVTNTYRHPARLFVDGECLLSEEGTTQGDPMAMPMYVIGLLPLMQKVASSSAAQHIWFADDFTAAGRMRALRVWWNTLEEEGHKYGYFINGSKSTLLVKPQFAKTTEEVFHGTNIAIMQDGCRHLGAGLGTAAFCKQFVAAKVTEWVKELQVLTRYAQSQPQAAYTAFTQGLKGKWTFLARTMPEETENFQPLEEIIHGEFIPALTGHPTPDQTTRTLLALPCRLGGMGLINPCDLASQVDDSRTITQPLVERIIVQNTNLGDVHHTMKAEKAKVRRIHSVREKETLVAVEESIASDLTRSRELAAEKGASSCLTCKPLKMFGFMLSKGATSQHPS